MMGQQSELQERLFYEFRLDDCVPVDHLLRKIDAALDLSCLRHELARFGTDNQFRYDTQCRRRQ